MLRRLTTLGVAIGALLVSSPAGAQQAGGAQFGDQGQFIFGADRLFGLFSFTQNQVTPNNTNATTTVTGTDMSFFGGFNTLGVNGALAGNPTIYNVPRLGFDYTIIKGLTLGGEVVAWFTLGGSTQQGNGPSNPNPGGSVFGFAPRVGYIFALNDTFAIWPRGGLSYYDANFSAHDVQFNVCNDTANANLFGLDIDPVFTISPAQHFAFMAGPTLDWGFTGGYSTSTPSNGNCSTTRNTSESYQAINFALNAGLLGWF